MVDTVIYNARIVTPLEMRHGVVVVREGRIAGIQDQADIPEGAQGIDAQNMYLTPGYVDIHMHGGGGHSVMEGTAEAVLAMCAAHARHGTTTILPTTLAAPVPLLRRVIDAVRGAQARAKGFTIAGVHLEGPYLSQAQRGAQSPDYLLEPGAHDPLVLLDTWAGVRMMGAAPELSGGLALGRLLADRGIAASIAHSDATYDEVMDAVRSGYCDVTHIYSGCSTIVRRNGYRVPGVVEAGLLCDALTVQVIADLKHLPVPLLQLVYRMKGAENISLVTDALEFAAAPLVEGTVYTQANGVQTVYEDGVMKQTDRQSFAGSVATMQDLVKNMRFEAGVPLCQAVRMATEVPARRIGLGQSKGRIALGYDADLLLLDDGLNVRWRMVLGRPAGSLKPSEAPA
jgi:N-acetylglucosamine-6-phosphate deacetylase